jgi:glyoxylase I family protein
MVIEHFALNVPDPVAMADWWVKHLGMRVARQVNGPPNTRFLADEAGRGVLEVYHQTVAAVPDYFNLEPLTVHVAFVVADLKAERQRLLTAGATSAKEIVTTSDGDEMTFLRDPWGVVIQLVKRAKPLVGPAAPPS